jgi:hypothetical protein
MFCFISSSMFDFIVFYWFWQYCFILIWWEKKVSSWLRASLVHMLQNYTTMLCGAIHVTSYMLIKVSIIEKVFEKKYYWKSCCCKASLRLRLLWRSHTKQLSKTIWNQFSWKRSNRRRRTLTNTKPDPLKSDRMTFLSGHWSEPSNSYPTWAKKTLDTNKSLDL